jgi:hypothetical protein
VVEPADPHLCCGSAGTYNLMQPEISAELKARKVATLEAPGPGRDRRGQYRLHDADRIGHGCRWCTPWNCWTGRRAGRAADWMSAPDIKRELVDTELAFRGRVSGKVIYREDGGMRMVSSAGRQIYGEWRIDDDTGSLCSLFYTRRQGKESCFRTRHDGFGYRTDQGYKLMPLEF